MPSLLKTLEAKLPRLSETERSALDAGTVWVDGEIFSGKPNFRSILEEPYPSLTEEEQAFLDGPVEEICLQVDPWRIQRERVLTPDVWDFLKENGFFGLRIPRRFGGLEFSQLACSCIFAKLVSRSLYLSTVVLIPNSVGPAELLLAYGTEEQKNDFLPLLALGQEIPCFALTEPEAGSDAAALTSQGIVFRDPDGKLKMRLSWKKRYITLAPVATLIGLAFRLRDPGELLGRGKDLGITCALVPAATPGVEIGAYHDPMGLPFPNGPTAGRDVVLPLEAIIGGPEMAGQGWRMLMEALSGGRAVSLPAQAVGSAKWTARVAGAYASVRQQFGLPIGRFEGVQEPLARIAGYTYLMDAARVFTCGAVDAGERPSVISAVVKSNLTELARQVVTDGMDILGGAGICLGPRNLLAEAHIGSPIGITVEGANILTRTLIVFGQGALRCHPYARREIEALEKQDGGALAKALLGHGWFFFRNTLRSTLLTFSRGRLASAPVSGSTAAYYRKLGWAAARFAALTDLALLAHGSRLKRRGRLTGRFADALSWIYLGLACLRRYEAEGRQEEDLPLVQWCLETSLERLQRAFSGIYQNFGSPILKPLLHFFLAPWARLSPLGRGPSDRLGEAVAATLVASDGQRERLTGGLFVSRGAIFDLETAMAAEREARPALAAIASASRGGQLPSGKPRELVDLALAGGIIDETQANQVLRAKSTYRTAIRVDTFTAEEYLATAPDLEAKTAAKA